MEVSQKKILVATGLFPPDIGGPATYVKTLKEELPKHDLLVDILSFGKVRKLPKVVRHVLFFAKVLSRASSCDVVFAQDPVSTGLPSVLAARLLKKRFVLKVVGDYAWEQGVGRFKIACLLDEFLRKKSEELPFFIRILKKVQSYVAQRADMVIVPSIYLKKVVLTWGVKKEKIYVIYNSHTYNKQRSNKAQLRELLKFHGKLLVSAGRLTKWKGFLTLIEVLPDLIREFPDIKLVIIGDGPEKGELENLARNLNLSDRHVALVGSLEKEILHTYIRASDVFVLNSGYEGFSHQILEVMELETPIITTRVGGNPEIIIHKKTGLLVIYNRKEELVEAIRTILKDKKLSSYLVKNAKDKVKKFSKEKMIKETVKILSLS